MSVRKRTWTTAKGVEKEAWVVDYVDRSEGGQRRLKTFEKKRTPRRSRRKRASKSGRPAHGGQRQHDDRRGGQPLDTDRRGEGPGARHARGLSRAVELHIKPYLGSVKLSQLSAPMVREFEDKLAREQCQTAPTEPRSRDGSKGQGQSVVADQRRARARPRGAQCRARPAVDPPTRDRTPGRASPERQAQDWRRHSTREEIKAIAGAAQGRWRPILLTAIFTGLRASELRGLRWADVDLVKGELHVRQRADRYSVIGKPNRIRGALGSVDADRREHVAGMETRLPEERARSRVPLDGRDRRASFQHRDARARADADRGWRTRTRKDRTATRSSGEIPGLHALRHFYASWCINRRADGGLELPAKVVQERLGHSSIMMTMDVYGHLFPRGDNPPNRGGRALAVRVSDTNATRTRKR